MSKYQPRILTNNPDKNIPDELIERFFLVLKEGDANEIRSFILNNKIKTNLFYKTSSGKSDSRESPAHIILSRVIPTEQKLDLLKLIDQYDMPLEAPDHNNVWPIHLAAQEGDPAIIDFLISKKVALNKTDSSNNTPLHYAIIGNQVNCPVTPEIKSLVPAQKIDKLPLSENLITANKEIKKLLQNNNDLSHIIKTITKLPAMYEGTETERAIKSEVAQMFSDLAADPNFTPKSVNVLKIVEKYINSRTDTFTNLHFNKLVEQMNIVPNNSGWNNILPFNSGSLEANITNKFSSEKSKINNLTLNTLTKIELTLDPNELITKNKIFHLLLLNSIPKKYPKIFAKRILDDVPTMLSNTYNAIKINEENRVSLITGVQFDKSALLFNEMPDLIKTSNNKRKYSEIDYCFDGFFTIKNREMAGNLNHLSWSNLKPIIDQTILNKFGDFKLLHQPISSLPYDIIKEQNKLRPAYQNPKETWLILIHRLIRELAPDYNRFYDNADGTYKLMYTSPIGVIASLNFLFDHLHGSFDRERTPDILARPLNKWPQFIDDLTNRDKLSRDQYPELSFLTKIFIEVFTQNIKKGLEKAVSDVIEIVPLVAIPNYANPTVQHCIDKFNILDKKVIDEAHFQFMLLPTEIIDTDFTDNYGKHRKLMNPIKDKKISQTILDQFNTYCDQIDLTLYTKLVDSLIVIDINYFFNYIELNQAKNVFEENLVKFPELNNILEKFTFGKMIITPQFQKDFNSLAEIIPFNNTSYDIITSKLSKSTITGLNAIHEIYMLNLVNIYKKFNLLQKQYDLFNKILNDIKLYIKNETYYQIPQIFLPALIKEIFNAINLEIEIIKMIDDFNGVKINFNRSITKTAEIDDVFNRINEINTRTVKYINDIVHKEIISLFEKHNQVIDYLNLNSAYQLHFQKNPYSKLFLKNLIIVSGFGQQLALTQDTSQIINTLSKYVSVDNVYYDNNTATTGIDLTVFVLDAANNPIKYVNIDLVPMTNNNGPLLKLDANEIKLNEVEIDYQPPNNFVWTDGMPPTISSLSDEHLVIVKQKIIEDVITDVNKKTNGVYDLLDEIATQPDFKDITIKVDVVTGRLTDTILNKLIKFAIHQTVSEWIYRIASKNTIYQPIAQATINVIEQNEYSQILLNKIDADLLTFGDKDVSMINIEEDPNNLPYVKKESPESFIHYLYSIDYRLENNNLDDQTQCYKINKDVIKRLITSDTLNAKNSDGNSPLHYAIESLNPVVVSLLIANGANKNGFKNNKQMTPEEMMVNKLNTHFEYQKGTTLAESNKHFTDVFNDLLLERIKDEKYQNNIIKNITMGIPIILVAYNHMFFNYLMNYRYGMSFDLKTKINKLINNTHAFPFDLFMVKDTTELQKILNKTDVDNIISESKNKINKKKIDDINIRIKEIDNQIEQLNKETDPSIPTIVAQLDTLKAQYLAKKADLVGPDIVDNTSLAQYNTVLDDFEKNSADRQFSIPQFYNYSFNKIGKRSEMYLNIWDNYLNHSLSDTYSPIFSILHNQLPSLIKQKKIDDIKTIHQLLTHVKTYIKRKNDFPKQFVEDENPMLYMEGELIIYLINLILTPSIKNIINREILSGLKEMGADPNALTEINRANYNNNTIDSYLTNILPKLALKYFTTFYNSSTDPDRLYFSENEIFQPIVDIIKSIQSVQITDSNVIITNFNTYLIPFFANSYQNFIHHLRLSIYSYERYLINSQLLLDVFMAMN